MAVIRRPRPTAGRAPPNRYTCALRVARLVAVSILANAEEPELEVLVGGVGQELRRLRRFAVTMIKAWARSPRQPTA